MSKITIIDCKLTTPTINLDLISQFSAEDPVFAKWIKTFNPRDLMGECAVDALKRICVGGIRFSEDVQDNYNNHHREFGGQALIGAMKTDKLPRGMGVYIDSRGALTFVGDQYDGDKKEFQRLQTLFLDAYAVELAKFYLELNHFNLVRDEVNLKRGMFQLEGEKHAES